MIAGAVDVAVAIVAGVILGVTIVVAALGRRRHVHVEIDVRENHRDPGADDH